MQALLDLIYPNLCLCCAAPLHAEGTLCPSCWRDTHFIHGLCCHLCGASVRGDEQQSDAPGVQRPDILCENCAVQKRPWQAGRSAMMYKNNARKLVLGLKHADRYDLLAPCAMWMARVLRPIMPPKPLFVPVPLHPRRLMWRTYNQSALLARQVAQLVQADLCLDALKRHIHTPALEHYSKKERANLLRHAIKVHRENALRGYDVILVDDVITTGATLSACARAAHTARARSVRILTLACVSKDL